MSQGQLYPVILCGGAGTRLWPASRPDRPKPFLDLTGPLSLFQLAVRRVLPLVENGGRLLVVGAATHADLITEQLAAVGAEATVLLEPEGRDSAAAVAAAAAWVEARDPDGRVMILASDHHIPDEAGYRHALTTAADAAGDTGRIVTLGVAPTQPSSAYGYIRPEHAGLAPVQAFIEKPDSHRAAQLILEGCLWNSGAFIATARTLREEMERHAPEIWRAVAGAVPEGGAVLGAGFAAAPRLSFDYAVMETTDRASVLPLTLAWSDLGAWDAVATVSENEGTAHLSLDSAGCLIRAPDGVTVATLGVSGLAVIVEHDAVLVCDLSRAQDVKRLLTRE